MSAERPLAVLGATGYTGRLVVEQARELGLPLRLVGRRREELEQLAREGEEIRVADARHEAELIEAFDGAFAVASMAGPFLEVGTKPVGAAIAVGAHYLDVSGEQAFARVVYEGFGESAEERDVVLLTSFGFDYVPGDLAARLAAESLEEPIDEMVVAYATRGQSTSAGTRRTIGHVMGQPQVAWEGRLVPSRFGKTSRRVGFPSGERSVIEWAGTEPLTVPRHTRVRSVRSYFAAPRAAALAGLVGPLVAPFVRQSGRVGGNPSPDRRAGNTWTVVAEARRGGEGRRATLTGRDTYGLAALLVAHGARALRAGEARGVGALAPAEAFDVHTFAPRLAALLEIAAVESI
ncbi:MAG: hypothetical protein QOI67_1952 [Gaiellaceae bacterium]|nr:hypothetical protein [Gaiellaceae bacterium]